MHEGLQPSDIRSRIRVGDSSTLIPASGVHLLTGHAGTGQQFDWVIVVGMEDGSIPNSNATTLVAVAEEARVLAVMLARARHGALLSHAREVPTLAEVVRPQSPSRFDTRLSTAGLLDSHGVVEWLKAADWDAIARR